MVNSKLQLNPVKFGRALKSKSKDKNKVKFYVIFSVKACTYPFFSVEYKNPTLMDV